MIVLTIKTVKECKCQRKFLSISIAITQLKTESLLCIYVVFYLFNPSLESVDVYLCILWSFEHFRN